MNTLHEKQKNSYHVQCLLQSIWECATTHGHEILPSNGNSTSKRVIWGLIFILTNVKQLRKLVLSCSHTGKMLVGALRIPLWTSFIISRKPNRSNLPPQVLSSLEFVGVPPSFFHMESHICEDKKISTSCPAFQRFAT